MKTITERIEALLKDAIKSQDNSIDNINDIGSEVTRAKVHITR